jgi:hypothetical protein
MLQAALVCKGCHYASADYSRKECVRAWQQAQSALQHCTQGFSLDVARDRIAILGNTGLKSLQGISIYHWLE